MKTALIVPGQVYGYSKGRYDSTHPALALDNKLWTMGKKWEKRSLGYQIVPASSGTRARGYSFSLNEVGIPVLLINNSGWQFSRTGDEKIVSDVAELLAHAKETLSVESLMEQQNFGQRPKTLCSVEAKKANGQKISLDVVLTTVLPSQIKAGWSEMQEDQLREAERKAQWDREVQARELERSQRDARIKSRLDALLGVDEHTPSWRGEHSRYDCFRNSDFSSEFRMEEATLIRLLELAEKGAEQ